VHHLRQQTVRLLNGCGGGSVNSKEAPMARLFVDCREYPSKKNCSIAISADNKEELLDAAAQHAIAVHGHHDSPELRQELAKMIKPQ
jgi:predicted small metal-binding protein